MCSSDLGGFDGAFINFNNLSYTVTSPDSFDLDVQSVSGTYGHSFTDNENTLKKPLNPRGIGFGVDLGLTYYHKRRHGAGDCNKSAEILKKYDFRTGIAMIDFGMVRFGKQAEVYRFDSNSFVWPQIDDAQLNSVAQFDSIVGNYAFSAPDGALNNDRLSIWLPSAIAFDFDYCIAPKYYADLAIVKAVPEIGRAHV